MRIDRSDLNALLIATAVAAALDATFAFVGYVVIALVARWGTQKDLIHPSPMPIGSSNASATP